MSRSTAICYRLCGSLELRVGGVSHAVANYRNGIPINNITILRAETIRIWFQKTAATKVGASKANLLKSWSLYRKNCIFRTVVFLPGCQGLIWIERRTFRIAEHLSATTDDQSRRALFSTLGVSLSLLWLATAWPERSFVATKRRPSDAFLNDHLEDRGWLMGEVWKSMKIKLTWDCAIVAVVAWVATRAGRNFQVRGKRLIDPNLQARKLMTFKFSLKQGNCVVQIITYTYTLAFKCSLLFVAVRASSYKLQIFAAVCLIKGSNIIAFF
jgi:hypothetical protein